MSYDATTLYRSTVRLFSTHDTTQRAVHTPGRRARQQARLSSVVIAFGAPVVVLIVVGVVSLAPGLCGRLFRLLALGLRLRLLGRRLLRRRLGRRRLFRRHLLRPRRALRRLLGRRGARRGRLFFLGGRYDASSSGAPPTSQAPPPRLRLATAPAAAPLAPFVPLHVRRCAACPVVNCLPHRGQSSETMNWPSSSSKPSPSSPRAAA